MSETGRIKSAVRPEVAAIVFGENTDAALRDEIEHYTRVDLAHVLGLQRAGVIPSDAATRLIRALHELRFEQFRPLKGKPAPRGLYLLYEAYLIEKLGQSIGGWLQLGRSRNDLSATVMKLRLRTPFTDMTRVTEELVETLCGLAERWADAVMPAYTHYQPAVPVTYGHYCAGVAQALTRDWEGLLFATDDLDSCPLGACAVGGTSVPIRVEDTARWLGFTESVLNSIDAVASRDVALRLLGQMSVLGVTISRVASDLLLWSTQEFGFLLLPDHVVGSSSMMPQKRNPYLLEHVEGRAMTALGGFCASVAMMAKTPFSNSVVVSNEAMRGVWGALQSTREALFLLGEMLAAAQPQPGAMLARAEQGFTSATRTAELLSLRGLPFRVAHHRVGELVSRAVELEKPLSAVAGPLFAEGGITPVTADQARRDAVHGGGPSFENLTCAVHRVRHRANSLSAQQRERERRWAAAAAELEAEIEKFLE